MKQVKEIGFDWVETVNRLEDERLTTEKHISERIILDEKRLKHLDDMVLKEKSYQTDDGIDPERACTYYQAACANMRYSGVPSIIVSEVTLSRTSNVNQAAIKMGFYQRSTYSAGRYSNNKIRKAREAYQSVKVSRMERRAYVEWAVLLEPIMEALT